MSKDDSVPANEEQAVPEIPEGAGPRPSPGWDIASFSAQAFSAPSNFPTHAELIGMPKQVPTIFVSALAMAKMRIIVGAIDMEVGWLGTARRHGIHFTIDDVFLFDQDVSYGHTEITTDSMSNVMQEVLSKPGGDEVFNSTRFWGHSHGSGGTSPSGQDDDQMHAFETFGPEFFIRGIFNRIGGASFSVYDWNRRLAFHNAPWRMTEEPLKPRAYSELEQALFAEMQKRVTYRRVVYKQPAVTVPVKKSKWTKTVRWHTHAKPDLRYQPWDPRRYGTWS